MNLSSDLINLAGKCDIFILLNNELCIRFSYCCLALQTHSISVQFLNVQFPNMYLEFGVFISLRSKRLKLSSFSVCRYSEMNFGQWRVCKGLKFGWISRWRFYFTPLWFLWASEKNSAVLIWNWKPSSWPFATSIVVIHLGQQRLKRYVRCYTPHALTHTLSLFVMLNDVNY